MEKGRYEKTKNFKTHFLEHEKNNIILNCNHYFGEESVSKMVTMKK